MTPESAAPMRALSFLLGDWELDYTVTRQGRTTKTIRGTGSMRYLFDETYLTFDYRTQHVDTGEIGQAHGIFAWDAKSRQYRYYWFESSGSFLQATCVLRDEDTLAMEWLDIDCTQIFQRQSPDTMFLEMRCPAQDVLLRVDFSRLPAAAQPH
jgi:hypothetical protein